MRQHLAVALVLISACTPATSDEAVLRQPLPAFAVELPNDVTYGETPDARLGTSLAACEGGPGFVAGAPGLSGVYASRVQGFVRLGGTTASSVGDVVLCDRTSGLALAGGTGGLYRFLVDGGSEVVLDLPALALATAPLARPLATTRNADGGTTVWHLSPSSNGDPHTLLKSAPSVGFGTGLAYYPGGERVVVGDPSTGFAYLYKLGDGDFAQQSMWGPGDTTALYGSVVLIADVTADPGVELIVSSPANAGSVTIYSSAPDGGQPIVIEGASLGGVGPGEFGAALAVEPGFRGRGVRALWIGEPGTSRVHRCLGSECEVYVSPFPYSRFGASLAFDGLTLVVGAPAYTTSVQRQSEGAVFEYKFDAGFLDGEGQRCDVGDQCSFDCRVGRCIGGVFCQATGPSMCAATERCVLGRCEPEDAGTPDAGERDAGAPDAGGEEADAGVDDAGLADAGALDGDDLDPVTYRSGCASAPGALWVILACLGWRRRRGD